MIAGEMGIKRLCAVCNARHYAMNHVRLDRKVKVNFANFWKECAGKFSADYRFYEIPVAENLKSMAELKPSKRAQHRRSFEKIDEIAAQIIANLKHYQHR